LVGGAQGAIGYGSSVAPSANTDFYLSRQAFEQIGTVVAYVFDPLGGCRLRIVDQKAWGLIPAGNFAPIGAVALDLLDSSDPRHWVAAEDLVKDA
jgi:hypothetical protein